MSKLKIFCFGFGQVAESFINKLINEKKDFDLSITSRQETHQIDFNNIKINSYQFSENKADENLILKIKRYCKKKSIKFYLSNNIELAIKLNLDGAYIPSFNKSL